MLSVIVFEPGLYSNLCVGAVAKSVSAVVRDKKSVPAHSSSRGLGPSGKIGIRAYALWSNRGCRR